MSKSIYTEEAMIPFIRFMVEGVARGYIITLDIGEEYGVKKLFIKLSNGKSKGRIIIKQEDYVRWNEPAFQRRLEHRVLALMSFLVSLKTAPRAKGKTLCKQTRPSTTAPAIAQSVEQRTNWWSLTPSNTMYVSMALTVVNAVIMIIGLMASS